MKNIKVLFTITSLLSLTFAYQNCAQKGELDLGSNPQPGVTSAYCSFSNPNKNAVDINLSGQYQWANVYIYKTSDLVNPITRLEGIRTSGTISYDISTYGYGDYQINGQVISKSGKTSSCGTAFFSYASPNAPSCKSPPANQMAFTLDPVPATSTDSNFVSLFCENSDKITLKTINSDKYIWFCTKTGFSATSECTTPRCNGSNSYISNNNECIACPSGSTVDISNKTCNCPSGKTYDPDTNSCQTTNTTPPSITITPKNSPSCSSSDTSCSVEFNFTEQNLSTPYTIYRLKSDGSLVQASENKCYTGSITGEKVYFATNIPANQYTLYAYKVVSSSNCTKTGDPIGSYEGISALKTGGTTPSELSSIGITGATTCSSSGTSCSLSFKFTPNNASTPYVIYSSLNGGAVTTTGLDCLTNTQTKSITFNTANPANTYTLYAYKAVSSSNCTKTGNSLGSLLVTATKAEGSGASCSATTINHCALSASGNGATVGNCETGYSGTCNFKCNNGTWVKNTNNCQSSGGTGPGDCPTGGMGTTAINPCQQIP